MKIYAVLSLIIFLILLFFPFISLMSESGTVQSVNDTTEASDVSKTEEIQDTADEISVLRVSSGKIENVDMTEYIIGAVASEMPATFHEEALKAQAVACYTYTKWILKNADNSVELSHISDSSTTHQGYLNADELKIKWGEKYEIYYNKLKSIVEGLKGQYLTYDGEPILAVFHAISSGVTNSSEDVWGNKLPYLVSVSAPGDKLCADSDSQNSFSTEEFVTIAKSIENVTVNTKENMISDITIADSGYVSEVRIGEVKLTGREVRSLFSLSSPNFEVKYENGKYIFNVKGKGHGVGMSQYSADFMARQGSDYKEILSHFYPDTDLETEQ
ncbi:MAG: stage II sporulation protein D [Clostridia bacterium]|nr:stage II sporulation protein D [Clostridia bacterium]